MNTQMTREPVEILEEFTFFQAVHADFDKQTPSNVAGYDRDEIDSAVKQLVSKALVSNEVIDIFGVAGLKRPDVSILSEEFLEDMKHMPQKNLALKMLKKLLNDEIRSRSSRNVVQARSFADLLEQTIHRYKNRTIDATQVIADLLDLAKEMHESGQRGEQLGITDDELAFYDTLAENKSAVEVLGDKQLAVIALDLVQSVHANVTIDWTVKENAKTQMRILVKQILRKFDYPPALQESATTLVLQQAEILAVQWAN